MALYHLSEAMHKQTTIKEHAIPSPIQWQCVMTRGARLWSLWTEKDPNNRDLFPLAEDIFAHPNCSGFYNLFKKEEHLTECAGLAKPSTMVENIGGSLQDLLASMTKDVDRYAYALLTMPTNSTVAVIYRPGWGLFLFDSHGRVSTDTITFLQFSNHSDAAQYLLRRYKVGSIDQLSDEIYSLYNEVELAEAFSYSACLFTDK
jgi:hypothetical protein